MAEVMSMHHAILFAKGIDFFDVLFEGDAL
jgi:hypothetical protein